MRQSTRRRFAFNGERAFRRGQTALFQGVLHKHHAGLRGLENYKAKTIAYSNSTLSFLGDFLSEKPSGFVLAARFNGYILPLSNSAFAQDIRSDFRFQQ
jgi:hypothetical protein